MLKKTWELFEENSTEFLNSNVQIKNASFIRSGGTNSNISDISVNFKSKNIFSIECKLKKSQAAQFVVFNDVKKSRFFDSAKNKGNKDRRTPIIDHMNDNYKHYSSARSVELICNKDLMFNAVKEHYRDKKVLFFISSNHFEDFSKKNFIKVIGLNEIKDNFDISGDYRVKRSGTSDVPQKDTSYVKNIISEELGKCRFEINKNKLYLQTNKSLKSLYLDQKKYILSPVGKNTYRIKKRSNTQNSNIIFTLTFNPKNTTDNGLKKLREMALQKLKI